MDTATSPHPENIPLTGAHGPVDFGFGLGTEIRFDPTSLHERVPGRRAGVLQRRFRHRHPDQLHRTSSWRQLPPAVVLAGADDRLVHAPHHPEAVANPGAPEICGQLRPDGSLPDSGCQRQQPDNIQVHVSGFGSFPGTATWNFSSASDACPGDSPDLHSDTPDGCPRLRRRFDRRLGRLGRGEPALPLEGGKTLPPLSTGWPDGRVSSACRLLRAPTRQRSSASNSLACSGASIASGLIRRYEGIGASIPRRVYRAFRELLNLLRGEITGYRSLERVPLYPNVNDRLPPQLDQAQLPAVDALLVSIGANDLGVISMLTACGTQAARQAYLALARSPAPPALPWWGDSCGESEAGRILKKNIGKLPGQFAALNRDLEARGVPPDRVYLTGAFRSNT